MKIEGRWWDEIIQCGVRTLTPVKHNLVTVSGKVLLMAFLKNDPIGIVGVLFHATGTGEATWEGGLVPPLETDTQLVMEQKRVVPTSVFVTPLGDVSSEPTGIVRFKAEYKKDAFPGALYLREQGLFGGPTAIEESNSGYLIDIIRHAQIYKTTDMILNRYIELEVS